MSRLAEWSWHGLSVTLFVNRTAAKRVFTSEQSWHDCRPMSVGESHWPGLRSTGRIEAMRLLRDLAVDQGCPVLRSRQQFRIDPRCGGEMRIVLRSLGCVQFDRHLNFRQPGNANLSISRNRDRFTSLDLFGDCDRAANVFNGLSTSLFCSAYVSFA